MKIARFVLKIVALSLAAAAAVCAVIAYWDKLSELGDCAKVKRSSAPAPLNMTITRSKILLPYSRGTSTAVFFCPNRIPSSRLPASVPRM